VTLWAIEAALVPYGWGNAAIVCPEAVSDAIPLVQQNSRMDPQAPLLRKKGKFNQTTLLWKGTAIDHLTKALIIEGYGTP